MNIGSDFQSEFEEVKNAFESGGVEACRNLLERKRDKWKNTALDVAVIGKSGAGKSSFINAVRRLSADDYGSATVSVTETTEEIRSYLHPRKRLLKFWDLPGVGTERFPAKSYLSQIGVDRFDFFLLMTADRFTENDTWLGNEIHRRDKKYFFVRTKIGVDVSNNEKAHPRTHNKEAVVKDIRESTRQHLRKNGCEYVPVFLIDNYEPTKYDFEKLERRLLNELQKLKKTAFVLSLRFISEEMIRLKAEELRSRMWKVAALSGAVAAIPVPGMITAFDLTIVLKQSRDYFTQLGLDETSLRRYARVTSSDYHQLQSVVLRRLGYREMGLEGIKKLIGERAPRLPSYAAVAEVSRYIPIIGSLIAAPVSYGGTYNVLKLVLDEMESVALEVVAVAVHSAADAELFDDL